MKVAPSKPKRKAVAEKKGNGFKIKPDVEDAESRVEEDKGDSEQAEWRKGLMYRAHEALEDAAHEDWSDFEVDAEVVEAVLRGGGGLDEDGRVSAGALRAPKPKG